VSKINQVNKGGNMFSNQKHLDFSKNQAEMLLEKINKKLNNTSSKVFASNEKITIYFRKEDITKLYGLVIPDKIGHLYIDAKIFSKRQIKRLK
jgi:tetrahydromethanopterin S-methyltransferase subunit G